jgi:UrcA family protein
MIGSAAAAGWPAVDRAEQSPIVRSARVYVGDLHPDSAADAPTLYARIRIAAQATCGERELPESHFIDPDFRKCVKAAIKAAIARVDSAALNAYYRQHSNRERRG